MLDHNNLWSWLFLLFCPSRRLAAIGAIYFSYQWELKHGKVHAEVWFVSWLAECQQIFCKSTWLLDLGRMEELHLARLPCRYLKRKNLSVRLRPIGLRETALPKLSSCRLCAFLVSRVTFNHRIEDRIPLKVAPYQTKPLGRLSAVFLVTTIGGGPFYIVCSAS